MIQPDDDFDDDFDDDAIIDDDDSQLDVSASGSNARSHDARRRIEEILEKRRLKEEFGDLDFD